LGVVYLIVCGLFIEWRKSAEFLREERFCGMFLDAVKE